jgi:hypothetical protein
MEPIRPDLLDQVRAICLALPETAEKPPPPQGSMTGFSVAGKNFAWFCDNHHGDGRIALWLKAEPGVQQMLVATDPVRFFIPPYVGPKGWIGARVDVDGADWDEIAELVEDSYRMSAPRRLAGALDGAPH